MDDDSRETIEYLRAQPRGGLIRWASDHVTVAQPWSTHWIDVRIPDDGPPGMGWVWTILDPQGAERAPAEQLWQFPWPHDLDVHSVFDPFEGGYANELPVPVGESLPESVVARFERQARRVEEANRHRGRSEAKPVPAALFEELVARTGSAYAVRGGWTVRAVCDALSDWAERHAGRTDLRFEWDPDAEESAALKRARARLLARARAGGNGGA